MYCNVTGWQAVLTDSLSSTSRGWTKRCHCCTSHAACHASVCPQCFLAIDHRLHFPLCVHQHSCCYIYLSFLHPAANIVPERRKHWFSQPDFPFFSQFLHFPQIRIASLGWRNQRFYASSFIPSNLPQSPAKEDIFCVCFFDPIFYYFFYNLSQQHEPYIHITNTIPTMEIYCKVCTLSLRKKKKS